MNTWPGSPAPWHACARAPQPGARVLQPWGKAASRHRGLDGAGASPTRPRAQPRTPHPSPPSALTAELHICEPPAGRVTNERKLAAIRRMLSVGDDQGAFFFCRMRSCAARILLPARVCRLPARGWAPEPLAAPGRGWRADVLKPLHAGNQCMPVPRRRGRPAAAEPHRLPAGRARCARHPGRHDAAAHAQRMRGARAKQHSPARPGASSLWHLGQWRARARGRRRGRPPAPASSCQQRAARQRCPCELSFAPLHTPTNPGSLRRPLDVPRPRRLRDLRHRGRRPAYR